MLLQTREPAYQSVYQLSPNKCRYPQLYPFDFSHRFILPNLQIASQIFIRIAFLQNKSRKLAHLAYHRFSLLIHHVLYRAFIFRHDTRVFRLSYRRFVRYLVWRIKGEKGERREKQKRKKQKKEKKERVEPSKSPRSTARIENQYLAAPPTRDRKGLSADGHWWILNSGKMVGIY